MKRVYVAGCYSAIRKRDNSALGVLNNINRGVHAGVELVKLGYAPYIPWLDCIAHIANPEPGSLSIQDCYDWSMAWLEVSNAMLVLPGWTKSKGTQKEIKRALKLGIPVYFTLEELHKKEGSKNAIHQEGSAS